MSLNTARLAEFAKVDLSAASPAQRENLARVLQTHPSALDGVHEFARRTYPPPPPPGPVRVSDAEYGKMTSGQKLEYARQFDQRQFQRTQ